MKTLYIQELQLEQQCPLKLSIDETGLTDEISDLCHENNSFQIGTEQGFFCLFSFNTEIVFGGFVNEEL